MRAHHVRILVYAPEFGRARDDGRATRARGLILAVWFLVFVCLHTDKDKDQKSQTVTFQNSINRPTDSGMHTMGREDPRFNGADVIRIFDRNLSIIDKQFIVAFFFSLIPRRNPSRDVIDFLADLVGLIPGAGTLISTGRIAATTAQVVIDIADLFGVGVRDELVDLIQELTQLRALVDDLTDERDRFRSEARALEVENSNLAGDLDFLRGLSLDLEEDNQRLERENIALGDEIRFIRANFDEVRQCLGAMINLLTRFPLLPGDNLEFLRCQQVFNRTRGGL